MADSDTDADAFHFTHEGRYLITKKSNTVMRLTQLNSTTIMKTMQCNTSDVLHLSYNLFR